MTAADDPLADFDYPLPPRLIASRPPANRDGGRLLDLTGETPLPRRVSDFPNLLRAGDVLAVNDSRVMPARMIGRKTTGGRVEILAERVLKNNRLLAQARPARTLKAGAAIALRPAQSDNAPNNAPNKTIGTLRAEKRTGALWEFSSATPITELLKRAGEIPLPPYMRRRADAADAIRYQTVFARRDGSVAAPTAGLHFTDAMRATVKARGVEIVSLTLHVGAGTFAPIRGHPDSHKMHSERYAIPESTANAIRKARTEGRRVVIVGTTTLRALESSALRNNGEVCAGEGETDLFIRPGFEFHTGNLLLTNFHPPRSSLLMLACAFAGRERVLTGCHFAAKNNFRFLSYGDATLLPCRSQAPLGNASRQAPLGESQSGE